MGNLAPGQAAGYIFQFELAVLHLARLEKANDFLTIEAVDDLAVHKEDGTVLITVQAKHTISSSGTTFQDTSYALWRTLEIWIEKLENGTFNNQTEFVCASRKKIPDDALLRKLVNNQFDNVIADIEIMLQRQEEKLKQGIEKKSKPGQSTLKIINLIKYLLSKKKVFKIIKNNIKIYEYNDLREKLSSALLLTGDNVTIAQRDLVIHRLLGWVVDSSIYKWRNSDVAKFSKKKFDEKYYLLKNTPSIMNAIFREKRHLQKLPQDAIEEKKSDLFVRQIQDLNRRKDSKDRIIENAIQDFIYSDIELKHIIDRGDYTIEDFEAFQEACFQEWQRCNEQKVRHELTKYDSEKLNELGIEIFDSIMHNTDVKFDQDFSFTIQNEYIRNGSFLKLSNIPRIGWHPDWENIYRIS